VDGEPACALALPRILTAFCRRGGVPVRGGPATITHLGWRVAGSLPLSWAPDHSLDSDWPLALRGSLVASDTSIEAALEPVKLFKGLGKGDCNLSGRFAIQTLCLD
jgi:hypothetical protein